MDVSAAQRVVVLSPKIIDCSNVAAEEPSGGTTPASREVLVPALEWRRWLMLFYLSSLALLSDWICFSMSPIMHLVELWFSGFHPSWLVTVFLGVNVFSSFFEPEVVSRFGLRFAIVLGAGLMCLGCWVRAGMLGLLPATSYYTQLAGTVLVGLAQPFFQCTPAMLAANWFGVEERTLATTIALNANQAGIAMAYLVGATCIQTQVALKSYFYFFAWISLALTIGVTLQFRGQPRVAPTPSALAKRMGVAAAVRESAAEAAAAAAAAARPEAFPLGETERGDFERGIVCIRSACSGGDDGRSSSPGSAQGGGGGRSSKARRARLSRWRRWLCGRRPPAYFAELGYLAGAQGFSHTVVAFTGVSVLANVVATFLDSVLYPLLPSQGAVGYVGAAFQVAFVGGSVVVSFVVDRQKAYFSAGLICFAAAAFCLFGVMLSIVADLKGICVLFVLLMGFFAGPIEPISAETAVEVSYPVDENVVMAVQQLFGNGVSSLAVPLFHAMRDSNRNDGYNRSLLALLTFVVVSMIYFSTFSAPLRRMHRDASESSIATRCAVGGALSPSGAGSTNRVPRAWSSDTLSSSCAEEEEALLAGGSSSTDETLVAPAWEGGGGAGGGGGQTHTQYASI